MGFSIIKYGVPPRSVRCGTKGRRDKLIVNKDRMDILVLLLLVFPVLLAYYFGKSRNSAKTAAVQPIQIKAETKSLVIDARAKYVGLVKAFDKYTLKQGEDLVAIGSGDLVYRDKAVKTVYLDKDGKEKEILVYLDYSLRYFLPDVLEDVLYAANKVDITKNGSFLFFDQPLFDAVEESAKKFNLLDWISKKYAIEEDIKEKISKLFRDARINPSSVYFNIQRASIKQ